MADPKLIAITKELTSRVSVIRKANAFNTDAGKTVIRGNPKSRSTLDELPATFIFIDSISPSESGGDGSDETVTFSVESIMKRDDIHPEDKAALTLIDLSRAIELQPTFPPKNDPVGKLKREGKEIFYPPDESNVIGVRLVYSKKINRPYGNP